MKRSTIKLAGALLGALTCAGSLLAQNVGQWDFDNGDLTQTTGATLGDLAYYDGPAGPTSTETLFGSTTNLGIPSINGTNAFVMKFPGGRLPEGFLMPTPPANGGGTLVNQYTVIMDVLYPQGGILRPLIQMDDGTLDNIRALWDIGRTDGIEVTNTLGGSTLASGVFGTLTTNTWYRLALVLDTTAGTATVYTNGTTVGILNFGAGNVDSPFALFPGDMLPIFSSTFTNAPGYVNSVQVSDQVLSPGEMEALGGPSAAGIPLVLPPAHSYIVSRTPNVGDTGINPVPAVSVVVDPGSTTINAGSISLALDGSVLPTSVTADANNASEFDVNAQVTTILDPQSMHTLSLTYSDSLLGLHTKSWSFTVANYQNITLPTPIYSENFDAVAEGSMPDGWSVTNNTVPQTSGYDLNKPKSDTYKDFVVISSNRLSTVFSSHGTYSSPNLGTATGNRRLVVPPIVLNGSILDSLAHGNLAYADSDQRQNTGGQVNVMFSKDYDLSAQTNVYLAFNSLYEQNQDNIGSVEYSIDQGATWLPALYMLDDGTTDGDGSDVVTNAATGQIDVWATFGTPRSDQAYGLAYSNFIGAVVSTNLIPYISPRRNDDPISSKRIEVIRLPLADKQSHVRFRFGQAGTSSWYFGIDNFGLYSITTPVISSQPGNATVNANTPYTFAVTASGSPLTYQWRFNGVAILGATNRTYTIASVNPTNAGTYQVIVGGVTRSAPAVLTVNTTPVLTADLSGEIVDPGATVTFTGYATGGQPLTYQLYLNGSLVSSSTSGSFILNNVQAANAGNYQLLAVNSYGTAAGSIATLRVFAGSINSNLVVHLPFDGDLNDTSGRGNHAAYMTYGANASPAPRFVPGLFGQAFEYTTTNDYSDIEYATLGYPADLQFGATNDWTVSLWCNYTNQGDDLPFISNKDWDSSSNLGWGIFTQSGGNYRVNITGPNGGADKFSYTDTPHTLKDGNWHHVLVSVQHAPFGQSAYVYAYLDGALVSKHPLSVAGTVDTFGTPITDHQQVSLAQSEWAVNIGQDGTGIYTDGTGAHDIDAKIDDVGIWRRALTSNEASAIYNAGVAGKDLSQVMTPFKLIITLANGNANLFWIGSSSLKLQQSTSLNPANWTDVPATLGASSAVVPVTGSSTFFRLSQ